MKRIAIYYNLSHVGGAEKVRANLANACLPTIMHLLSMTMDGRVWPSTLDPAVHWPTSSRQSAGTRELTPVALWTYLKQHGIELVCPLRPLLTPLCS